MFDYLGPGSARHSIAILHSGRSLKLPLCWDSAPKAPCVEHHTVVHTGMLHPRSMWGHTHVACTHDGDEAPRSVVSIMSGGLLTSTWGCSHSFCTIIKCGIVQCLEHSHKLLLVAVLRTRCYHKLLLVAVLGTRCAWASLHIKSASAFGEVDRNCHGDGRPKHSHE